MQARHGLKAKLKSWPLQGYVYSTAVMLGIMGLFMLFSSLDNVPPLRQLDALFGLTTRTVLVLTGILHLAVSSYLFVGRDLMNKGIIALWAGSNHTVYYVGIVWVMKVAPPLPAEVALAWSAGLSSQAIDLLWKVIIAYLLIGSLSVVALEWQRLKELQIESFVKDWGEARDREVAAARQRGPSKAFVGQPAAGSQAQPSYGLLKAPGPGAFKFSCPRCGQHIQCEDAYSGRWISCPACHEQILVPRADASL